MINRGKKILYCLIPFFLVFGLSQCTKEKEKEYPGNFTTKIDGADCAAYYYEAKYYPNLEQVIIHASFPNDEYHLSIGINLDSASPLKSYSFKSNRDNVAEVYHLGQFNSDHNVADVGGEFILTKFDVATGKLSGSFDFEIYSGDRKEKLVLSEGKIIDIPLETYYPAYDGSMATATVEGVETGQWRSKNIKARIACWSGRDDKSLEVDIGTPIGGYPNHHFLMLRIPLKNLTGTFPILSDEPPYFYCGTKNITSKYSLNNIGESYYPTEGTIEITHLDTTSASRKLTANFNITYKNIARDETIRIINGHLQLNGWTEDPF